MKRVLQLSALIAILIASHASPSQANCTTCPQLASACADSCAAEECIVGRFTCNPNNCFSICICNCE